MYMSSPLRHAGLDAAGATQSGQSVLPVGPMSPTSSSTAEAHVNGLTAGVHAAHGGEAHTARPTMSTQRALPAWNRRAAEGGSPGQAVRGASGGVEGPWARGLWMGKDDVTVLKR